MMKQVTAQDQKKIVQIVKNFFMRETNNDEEQTSKMLTELAKVIQGPGAKLVHLGDNVYIVQVQDKNHVEIDNLSRTAAVKNLGKLIKFLKGIDVKVAVYSTKEKIKPTLDKLNIKYSTRDGDNDETVYKMEL